MSCRWRQDVSGGMAGHSPACRTYLWNYNTGKKVCQWKMLHKRGAPIFSTCRRPVYFAKLSFSLIVALARERPINPHLRAKSRLRRLRSETRLRAQSRGVAKRFGFTIASGNRTTKLCAPKGREWNAGDNLNCGTGEGLLSGYVLLSLFLRTVSNLSARIPLLRLAKSRPSGGCSLAWRLRAHTTRFAGHLLPGRRVAASPLNADVPLTAIKRAAERQRAWRTYLFFQVLRLKSTSMGKISRRPASMAQDRTSLLRVL